MKTTINDKAYSTYDAKCLGYRHIGEYGHQDGFEEQLYVADDGQHFIFGVGGPESPYIEPEINFLTKGEASSWKKRAKNKKRID
jgi:hypothetical protein